MFPLILLEKHFCPCILSLLFFSFQVRENGSDLIVVIGGVVLPKESLQSMSKELSHD